MKKIRMALAMAAALCIAFAGCSNNSDNGVTSTPTPTPQANPLADKINGVGLVAPAVNPTLPEGTTDFVYVDSANKPNLMALVFNYPSTDQNGNTITLSAVIYMHKDLQTSKGKADFLLLYNRGTLLKSATCPSEFGNQNEANSLIGLKPKAIAICADYMGFGTSSTKDQAYCCGVLNARASLDALRNAKKLLADKGYTWEDKLYNIGYSQGGQTTIAVQKLVDTTKPYCDEITITKTFAGGGTYDMKVTADESIKMTTPYAPEYTLLCIYTYNALFDTGIKNDEKIFKDLTALKASKIFSNPGSAETFTSLPLSNWLQDIILPKETSSVSKDGEWNKKLVNIYALDQACYWTPKATTHISLFHASNDEIVPSKNSDALYDYLKKVGYNIAKVDNPSSSTTLEGDTYIKCEVTAPSPYPVHGYASSLWQAKVMAELN